MAQENKVGATNIFSDDDEEEIQERDGQKKGAFDLFQDFVDDE